MRDQQFCLCSRLDEPDAQAEGGAGEKTETSNVVNTFDVMDVVRQAKEEKKHGYRKCNAGVSAEFAFNSIRVINDFKVFPEYLRF